MDDKLTIFYNKRTGAIKELCGGEQDMNWFGEEAKDYELIFDYLIVDYDPYILENYMNMKVINDEVKIIQNDVPEKYM